jgi:hypothetical protein
MFSILYSSAPYRISCKYGKAFGKVRKGTWSKHFFGSKRTARNMLQVLFLAVCKSKGGQQLINGMASGDKIFSKIHRLDVHHDKLILFLYHKCLMAKWTIIECKNQTQILPCSFRYQCNRNN